MTETPLIENYPGFAEGVDGFTLGESMQRGAERFGARTIRTEVLSVELREPVKRIVTDEGTFLGKTVILATGAGHRHLGVAHEEELIGRGVGYCAACDGMLYRKKTVAVVGGGNSAASDALLLSKLCAKVYLIHRRDTLRATKVYHDPLMKAENVEFLWESRVGELLFDKKLRGVRVEHVKSGERKEIELDGLFISIGRSPATELYRGQITLDESGYIVADESTKTNLDGVFAAGDIRTKDLRQIVTAASDGAVAAYRAEGYLAL
jgi:thioredoxin reductase (NADPH)